MHKNSHAVMFHHFHDNKHLPTQGSLSSRDFTQMIDWLNKHYSILHAGQYKENLEKGTLKDTDICLSFDDALKCQFDIAVPVMERLGIEAFFFIYSNALGNNPDPLEIYRLFRSTCYENIDEFYKHFFYLAEQIDVAEFSRQSKKYTGLNYLGEFSFYTENDKWFRYLRDHYLYGAPYDELMNELMIQKNFDANAAKKELWMSEEDVVITKSKGHIIGLHSYSHPTLMSKLSKVEQELEYRKNYEHLTALIGEPIKAMAHPCGNYNDNTLEVLKNIGIEIGFRHSMFPKEILSSLEIPREDHAHVLREMHQ